MTQTEKVTSRTSTTLSPTTAGTSTTPEVAGPTTSGTPNAQTEDTQAVQTERTTTQTIGNSAEAVTVTTPTEIGNVGTTLEQEEAAPTEESVVTISPNASEPAVVDMNSSTVSQTERTDASNLTTGTIHKQEESVNSTEAEPITEVKNEMGATESQSEATTANLISTTAATQKGQEGVQTTIQTTEATTMSINVTGVMTRPETEEISNVNQTTATSSGKNSSLPLETVTTEGGPNTHTEKGPVTTGSHMAETGGESTNTIMALNVTKGAIETQTKATSEETNATDVLSITSPSSVEEVQPTEMVSNSTGVPVTQPEASTSGMDKSNNTIGPSQKQEDLTNETSTVLPPKPSEVDATEIAKNATNGVTKNMTEGMTTDKANQENVAIQTEVGPSTDALPITGAPSNVTEVSNLTNDVAQTDTSTSPNPAAGATDQGKLTNASSITSPPQSPQVAPTEMDTSSPSGGTTPTENPTSATSEKQEGNSTFIPVIIVTESTAVTSPKIEATVSGPETSDKTGTTRSQEVLNNTPPNNSTSNPGGVESTVNVTNAAQGLAVIQTVSTPRAAVAVTVPLANTTEATADHSEEAQQVEPVTSGSHLTEETTETTPATPSTGISSTTATLSPTTTPKPIECGYNLVFLIF